MACLCFATQANLVGKAAFSYATGYAARQISGLIQQQISQDASPECEKLLKETQKLHQKLLHELEVINRAVDLCEVISSRGNAYLKDILCLAEDFKREVEHLGSSAEGVMNKLQELNLKKSSSGSFDAQIKKIERLKSDIERILQKAADLAPFLLLSMQTSGINHNVYLASGTSPSQLLNASRSVAAASDKFDVLRMFGPSSPPTPVIVGHPMTVKLYNLFTSHSRKKGYDDFTWKELIPKCEVSIERTAAPRDAQRKYLYVLRMKQNQNDGLYHEDDNPEHATCFSAAVDNIKLLYYSTSGSILKISDTNAPVLIMKLSRDPLETEICCSEDEEVIKKILEKKPDSPSWHALELYNEDAYESKSDDEISDDKSSSYNSNIAKCNDSGEADKKLEIGETDKAPEALRRRPKIGELSWLEYIIRLTSLEMKLQRSHLSAKDEQLCLALSNSVKESHTYE